MKQSARGRVWTRRSGSGDERADLKAGERALSGHFEPAVLLLKVGVGDVGAEARARAEDAVARRAHAPLRALPGAAAGGAGRLDPLRERRDNPDEPLLVPQAPEPGKGVDGVALLVLGRLRERLLDALLRLVEVDAAVRLRRGVIGRRELRPGLCGAGQGMTAENAPCGSEEPGGPAMLASSVAPSPLARSGPVSVWISGFSVEPGREMLASNSKRSVSVPAPDPEMSFSGPRRDNLICSNFAVTMPSAGERARSSSCSAERESTSASREDGVLGACGWAGGWVGGRMGARAAVVASLLETGHLILQQRLCSGKNRGEGMAQRID